MNLRNHEVLILVVIAISALIVASPALQRLLVYPQTEYFTELWLLGPSHMAQDFPRNITRGENYNVFLGISNHLGYCAYYSIQVKFFDPTQPRPNSQNHTPSSLEPIYSVNAFVANKETWELPITFSFDYSQYSYSSEVNFTSLSFNNVMLDIRGQSTPKDSETGQYLGYLVFELWIYNSTTGVFQYHERYVDLKLNMLV